MGTTINYVIRNLFFVSYLSHGKAELFHCFRKGSKDSGCPEDETDDTRIEVHVQTKRTPEI
jgi:hypothetical protein